MFSYDRSPTNKERPPVRKSVFSNGMMTLVAIARRGMNKSTSSERRRCFKMIEPLITGDSKNGAVRCLGFSACANAIAARFNTRLDDAPESPTRLRTARSIATTPPPPPSDDEAVRLCYSRLKICLHRWVERSSQPQHHGGGVRKKFRAITCLDRPCDMRFICACFGVVHIAPHDKRRDPDL